MWNVIIFLAGAIVGAVGAVIYYRRNAAKVEATLVDAKAARDKAEGMVRPRKAR